MSASAWDRAVEASVATLNREEWSSALPGYCLSETVLAAALPVLLEELADALQASDIEKAGPGCCNWDFGSNVKNKAVRIVRGFAAEVTQ